MILGEILEQAVSIVKTVWQKRGDQVTRKEHSRLLATDVEPRSRKTIKVSNASE
jgi:hypothetical protein